SGWAGWSWSPRTSPASGRGGKTAATTCAATRGRSSGSGRTGGRRSREVGMAEFDQGIKMIAETTGRQLARAAGVPSQQWAPLESTLQVTTERLADRVFQARQGRERFVVYFEFYTTWDRDAPWDMLAKSGLLSQREKLPTVCIPVVFRKKGFRSPGGQLRLEAAG